MESSPQVCPICQEVAEGATILGCSHVFCAFCIGVKKKGKEAIRAPKGVAVWFGFHDVPFLPCC